MSAPETPAGNRRAVLWALGSLAVTVVVGVLLTWGAKGMHRWGALPLPQSPAWYDCAVVGTPFALQYLRGSDHLALQWPGGQTLQGDSYPDRLVWRDTAKLDAERRAVLPIAFRYESAQRLELVNAAGQPTSCARRAAVNSIPSAP